MWRGEGREEWEGGREEWGGNGRVSGEGEWGGRLDLNTTILRYREGNMYNIEMVLSIRSGLEIKWSQL